MEVIIAEFADRYLAESAKHPQIKDFYSLPYLADRFFFYNSEEVINVSGEEALLNDLEQLTHNNRIKRYPIGYHRSELNRPNLDYRALRDMLRGHETIVVFGSKRGSSYGNINARPTLSDKTIAHLIRMILKSNPGPHRWTDLCTPVITMVREIHLQGVTIADTDPERIFSAKIRPSGSQSEFLSNSRKTHSIPHSARDELYMKFAVKIPQIGQQEQTYDVYGSTRFHRAVWPRNNLTDEQFESWIDVNYSEDWFIKKTSNIQRLLKAKTEGGIGEHVIAGNGTNGAKRGMWVHAEQIEDFTKSSLTNLDTLQMIQREVSKFMHTSNLESPAEKYRLEQLKTELRFLSDEIERHISKENTMNG